MTLPPPPLVERFNCISRYSQEEGNASVLRGRVFCMLSVVLPSRDFSYPRYMGGCLSSFAGFHRLHLYSSQSWILRRKTDKDTHASLWRWYRWCCWRWSGGSCWELPARHYPTHGSHWSRGSPSEWSGCVTKPCANWTTMLWKESSILNLAMIVIQYQVGINGPSTYFNKI